MDILNAFNRLPPITHFGVRRDDDFADRLNYKYTVALLVFFSIVVASKQFSNDHIQCWVPAIFTRNYEIYVSNYCWIHNTYHINISEPSMQRANEKRYVLRYYQFVPFILLIQALLFLLPRLCWRSVSRHSGIDVRNLMDAAHNLKNVKRFHKHKSIMNYLVSLLHQYVGDPRKKLKQEHSRLNAYIQGIIRCVIGSTNTFNAYLFILYLFTKLLSIANAIFQLYAIRVLLEQKWTVNETINGLRQIFTTNILRANPFSKYFPKISVLTINVYNEQVFTVLYIWMVFVLGITVYNFLSWFLFLIFPRLRYSFFTQRLNTQQSISTMRTGINAFVYDYLQQDGFFILRLIHSNVGDDVTSNILTTLWRNFQRSDKPQPSSDNINGTTVSLTATGGRGIYSKNDTQNGSAFEFSKSTTNL